MVLKQIKKITDSNQVHKAQWHSFFPMLWPATGTIVNIIRLTCMKQQNNLLAKAGQGGALTKAK